MDKLPVRTNYKNLNQSCLQSLKDDSQSIKNENKLLIKKTSKEY